MNAKNFAVASIAAFVFIFIFDFLFHGFYLKNTYEEIANLWPPEEAMKRYMVWLTLGQIVISIGFVALFTKAFKRGGLAEGAIFGFLVAIIFIGNLLIWYAVSPYPTSLLINLIVSTLIELVLAGIIVAFIYKSKSNYA
jgi:hypothetical protein